MYVLLLLFHFICSCKKIIKNFLNSNTEETQLPTPNKFDDFKNFRLKDIYEIKNSDDAIPKGYKRISNNLHWSPYEHPEEFNAGIKKQVEDALENGYTGDLQELYCSLLYRFDDSHSSEMIVIVLDSEPMHYFEFLKHQLLLSEDPFPLLVDAYNKTSFKEYGYTFTDWYYCSTNCDATPMIYMDYSTALQLLNGFI